MNIVSYIIIGIAVFLSLALGIIFFVILYQRRVINHQIQMRTFNQQKQLELMQASIRSEEMERLRIATDLHDDVGASLSSVRLYLYQTLQHPHNKKLAQQTKELLDDTIQKVRNLSHQLQPGTLQYLGLAKTLHSLADIVTKSKSLEIRFELVHESWKNPPDEQSLAIYRIVQELINNIIKHASASTLTISLQDALAEQSVTITHNGQGLTAESYETYLHKEGAIGLKNIEYRIKSAGLRLSFRQTDQQYETTVHIPKPASF